jgi:hypothetical protein
MGRGPRLSFGIPCAIEPQLSLAMRTLARGVNLHDAIIEAVVWNPAILYDEVDFELEDGEPVLSHRLLFWPEFELTIDFRELRLERSPRSDRRVDLSGVFQLVQDDDAE